MNCNKKIFLTSKQHIQLLKDRNLKIDDDDKLLWYLETIGYSNLINGYNNIFMKNFDRKTNIYSSDITSQNLIDLFNFDRLLSKYLFDDICNIERMLNSQLTKYLLLQFSSIEELKYGLILKLKDEDFLKVFKYFKPKNNKSISKEIAIFKKNLIKSVDKKIIEKYKKTDEIPFWYIMISISFGQCIEMYYQSHNNIKKKIIASFFKVDEHLITKNDCYDFFRLLDVIRKVRNRICHNNVLFDFRKKKYRNFDNFVKKFLYIKNNNGSNYTNILSLINIICHLNPFKLTKTKELINEKKNKFSDTLPIQIKNYFEKKYFS